MSVSAGLLGCIAVLGGLLHWREGVLARRDHERHTQEWRARFDERGRT